MVMVTLIISLSYHIISCHVIMVIVISLKTLACTERCVYEKKKLKYENEVRTLWYKVWGWGRDRIGCHVSVYMCLRHSCAIFSTNYYSRSCGHLKHPNRSMARRKV